jgi:hypothetical protein
MFGFCSSKTSVGGKKVKAARQDCKSDLLLPARFRPAPSVFFLQTSFYKRRAASDKNI